MDYGLPQSEEGFSLSCWSAVNFSFLIVPPRSVSPDEAGFSTIRWYRFQGRDHACYTTLRVPILCSTKLREIPGTGVRRLHAGIGFLTMRQDAEIRRRLR
jgi:hypothetical protein